MVTQGADTVELTLLDVDLEIDAIENTVSGSGPAGLGIALDGCEGQCARGVPQAVDGTLLTDYDDPVDNPEDPGCLTTRDPGPGDVTKLTDNGPLDGADCCQTVVEARVIDFTDDDGSIFENDITWLAQEGITAGCNPPANDMFCPNDSVTRGQMATFLVRALRLTPSDDNGPFTDHLASVHRMNINALRISGITTGCAADRYCPGDPVKRAQTAAFLHRAFG